MDRASGTATPPGRGPIGFLRSFPIPVLAIGGLVAGYAIAGATSRPEVASAVWFATLVLGGAPLVVATARRLLRGEFASDVIASVAIVAAALLDEPFAGVIIVLMQSGGEGIERYAFRRASGSLEALVRRAPRRAQRHENGQWSEVPVESVRAGDRLLVRSGDLLPVDGRVDRAPATLDESSVTGEPVPRTHPVGETVLSGTVCVGPAFELVALRPSSESQYMRVVGLVRDARARKPVIQRLADRYAAWFTPLALGLAVLAGAVARNPTTGLAVLVVATPCPLIVATPIAVLGAIDRASARGTIVKSGAAIEELGRARVVLFDKTGTLTRGHPDVDRVVTFSGAPADEVLEVAAAVERFSSHPIARAILRSARPTGARRVHDVHEFPGAGVAGTVGGRRVVVGSRELVEELIGGPLATEWRAVEASGPMTGRLVAFVVTDGRPIGAVLLHDAIREEAIGLGPRLREAGVVEVGLLTGDRSENAEEVARQVGIDRVAAGIGPERKVELVGEYRRRFGGTVMVGDGINDAAALASASVGVAMGAGGAGISAEAADVVLMVEDLSRVPEGIALGRRMLRVAEQGILFGLGASLLLMGVAALGGIVPAEGAVLQEGLDVVVIFNALRVR